VLLLQPLQLGLCVQHRAGSNEPTSEGSTRNMTKAPESDSESTSESLGSDTTKAARWQHARNTPAMCPAGAVNARKAQRE
jgi:hypothetical protein